MGSTWSVQVNVEAVLTALLAAAILSSTPIMLAAVGEAIGEKAGLLNLGIEGVMLVGALAGFWIALETGSIGLGLAGGMATGVVLGVGFGWLATYGAADQVVLGLGLTLAGTGGTAFMFRELYGSNQPLLGAGMGRPLDGLFDWVPVLGPAIGQQRWFVFVAWGLVFGAHWLLTRTTLGLQIRAAGDSPLGLESVGGSVSLVRVIAATMAGALSGLAGATLATVELGFFIPGLTMGAGFLAVALAMLGQREPLKVALAALGFGLLTGLDTGLQIADVDVRPEFLQMAPYLGIVVALLIGGRNSKTPRALGQPYQGLQPKR
jgi:simple sugar transport system permease protein